MNKSSDDQNQWAEFREYFEKFVVSDIEKSLNAELEVGTVILTVLGIECLSGYYSGKPTEKTHFVGFINEFMPKYAGYAQDIYELIRNGLFHDYIVKIDLITKRTFGFTRDAGEDHLIARPSNPKKIIINRVAFARDFLDAQRAYFERVESDQNLWDRAMTRLGKRGFLTVLREEEPVIRAPGTMPTTAASSYSTNISTGINSTTNPVFGKPKSTP